MAEMTIQDSLWNDLVAIAELKRQAPQDLVQQALKEYIQRLADEELLDRSAASARRAKFRASDAEAIVRQYRERKKSKAV